MTWCPDDSQVLEGASNSYTEYVEGSNDGK